MQPYQQAAQAKRRGEEAPLNLLKNAGLSFGAGAVAKLGSSAINKMAPAIGALISPYVPENIAKAGLNKLDPRWGPFIDHAMEAGYTFDNFREFMGEKVEKAQEPAKEERNIIEQYSPELHKFMEEQIKGGREAYAAGAIAQKDKRFASAIEKLQKDHKLSWADVIEQVYGGKGAAPKKGMMQREADRFNQAYPQEQGTGAAQGQAPNFSGQPQGPGMQAISAVLNKINQKLGG